MPSARVKSSLNEMVQYVVFSCLARSCEKDNNHTTAMSPHTVTTMAKGIFPPMSFPDIINALASWGISVSSEQLKSPNSEFVEGVYCACLQRVTDLSHDSLQEPVQNALTASQADDKVFLSTASLLFLYTESRYNHF